MLSLSDEHFAVAFFNTRANANTSCSERKDLTLWRISLYIIIIVFKILELGI